MNRRDFLRFRNIAQSAGQVLGAIDELQERPRPAVPSEYSLLWFTRQAMATDFEILLPFGTMHALASAEDGLNEIDALEDQLTVFRDSSEVSRINRFADKEPQEVEERLFALLQQAARLSAETEGAYDIATGALSKTWGFHRRQGRVPAEEDLAAARACVGMQHVQLDADKRTVRFDCPGLEINLGSIGKGYALDRVAELLRRDWNVTRGLLHGGHSSVYAMGHPPGAPRGWQIGVRDPWDPQRRLASVWLRDRALGTSAATFQHLEYNGRKLGHILDPRSGWPAEGLASATAIAPTAAEADALATAFFILGVEKTRNYCAAHPDVAAFLLPNDSATPVAMGTIDHTFV